VTGSVSVTRSGWLLLRAWNDGPQPEVLDNYPYATTSPVYVQVGDQARRSMEAATYFLRWLDRIRAATERDSSYRTTGERSAVLEDVARAREFYERCLREAR
jgi:TolB protein